MPFKNNRPPPRFNNGVPLLDATHAQLDFVNHELARFIQAEAWEPFACINKVSEPSSAQAG
jgi:hypothetical protein